MIKLGIFTDNVFVHEIIHLLLGVSTFWFVFLLFGKIELSLIAFFISIFIDVDHYLEGLLYNHFKLGWIFNTHPGVFWKKLGKLTILFHSWELLPLIFVFGKMFNQQPLAITVAVSFTSHLFVDNFIYSAFRRMPFFQYFLFYRIYNHFDLKKACRKN